jgi:hypothetical protein
VLILDAAGHGTPEEVRALWRAARARSAYFPVLGSDRLITGLVGHGVPDVVAELADHRRAQAAGGKFRLDRADRAALALADRETGDGHS